MLRGYKVVSYCGGLDALSFSFDATFGQFTFASRSSTKYGLARLPGRAFLVR